MWADPAVRAAVREVTGVNRALTPQRPPARAPKRRALVENDQFLAFTRRILRAAGRRIAGGDVESLRDLAQLSRDVDDALAVAVAGLRRHGYSWGEIADRLGVSRQACHKRWAHLDPHGEDCDCDACMPDDRCRCGHEQCGAC